MKVTISIGFQKDHQYSADLDFTGDVPEAIKADIQLVQDIMNLFKDAYDYATEMLDNAESVTAPEPIVCDGLQKGAFVDASETT